MRSIGVESVPGERRRVEGGETMFEPDEITRRTRTLRIIWYAMMIGVALYSGVVWFLLRTSTFAGIDIPQIVRTSAAVVIVLCVPLARLVRNKVQAVPRGSTADLLISKWVAGWIVGQAIREIVGIAGITLALLTGSIQMGLAFAAASVGSMLLAPPWESELRIRLRNAGFDPIRASSRP